jgi:predicted dehydrogenase
MSPIRIGILGAARIAPAAAIRPAAGVAEAEVTSVAARDPQRAAAFAHKHRIPKVAPSYQALIEDPEVDAIYNPLPNGLHAEWTLAAIAAGKHVLCEKPFTANSDEAAQVAEAASGTDLVVMEAFHYRYHPFARRVAEIIESRELGKLRRVETAMCFPLPKASDIRYQLELSGGATMDAGCYAIHMARLLGNEEPEVVTASAKLRSEQVDRAMTAEFRFPSGATGTFTASMWSSSVLRITGRAWGDRGRLTMLNPIAPQFGHGLVVSIDGRRRLERFTRRPTYDFQMEAFCAAVLRGEPVLTPPSDSIANMRVIDDVYRAAGLRPRGPLPPGPVDGT